MGLIPQAKCSRCDRKFSGLRTRCPYCGARRRKKGNRATDTDNSMWKLVVGILLLVVLIAAVVVLIVTSVSENKAQNNTQQEENNPPISSNEGVNSVTNPEATDPSAGDPSGVDPSTGTNEPVQDPEPPEPTVNSVVITYNGSRLSAYNDDLGMYEFSMKLGEEITLGARIDPDDTELTPVWECSDDSVLAVLQSGKITAIGKGKVTLKVTVGDVTDECLVRVN